MFGENSGSIQCTAISKGHEKRLFPNTKRHCLLVSETSSAYLVHSWCRLQNDYRYILDFGFQTFCISTEYIFNFVSKILITFSLYWIRWLIHGLCLLHFQYTNLCLSSSSGAFIEYNDIKIKKWRTSEWDWPVVVWGNVVDAVVITVVYLVVAAAGGASVSHIHSGWGVVGGGGSVPCTRKGGRSERAWSVKNTANHKDELNKNTHKRD